MGRKLLAILLIAFFFFTVGGLGAYYGFIIQEREAAPTQFVKPIIQTEKMNTSSRGTISRPKKLLITESVDTSTWKTFKFEKYGIEFKYPPVWKLFAHDENFVVFDVLGNNDWHWTTYEDDVTVKVYNLSEFLESKGVKDFDEWWNAKEIEKDLTCEEIEPIGEFKAARMSVPPFNLLLFWLKPPVLVKIKIPQDFWDYKDENGKDRSKEFIGFLQSLRITEEKGGL